METAQYQYAAPFIKLSKTKNETRQRGRHFQIVS